MLLLWLLIGYVWAKTHTYNFNVLWVDADPDGQGARPMIGVNGQFPPPPIRVKPRDRVIIDVHNGLGNKNTSLHFHGLFMHGQNSMDGPEMVTQCPIVPGQNFTYNFTVDDQTGLYWYHSHLGSQYADGLRGLFIIEDEDYGFDFDEEMVLLLSEHYPKLSGAIMQEFLSRYNPTGAEPIPRNSLFNETKNVTWHVQPDTTYLLRIVNMGLFTSQHFVIEDHQLTIVEIDGVKVEPYTVDLLYITVAQRYLVLVTTKKLTKKNFRMLNVIDMPMLDVIPRDLQIISTNYVVYDDKASLPAPAVNTKTLFDEYVERYPYFDDSVLVTRSRRELLGDPDYRINLNFTMDHLGDGVVYAFFNNETYVTPKVPTLYSVVSSGKYAGDSLVYGTNTNTFILQKDEVVEIVLNNMDPGKHPFHMHGHIFQLIARSEEGEEDDPIIYDPENSNVTFPEYPMMRDTVEVQPNGYMVLRFTADNPGVWFFHCHVDWHLEQGLAITLVELPFDIQRQDIPGDHFAACEAANVLYYGNAANHSGDTKQAWLNLDGQNSQKPPLPAGFTFKGYAAFAACAAAAIYGLILIYQYGIEDVTTVETEEMVTKLYQLIDTDSNE